MTLRALRLPFIAAVGSALAVVACPGPSIAPEGTPVTHERAGLACAADPDCGLDRCDRDRFPGGSCVGTCDVNRKCPQGDGGVGQVCLGEPSTGGCLRGCEADGSCLRAGWLCQDSAGGRVCLPDCRQAPRFCGGADAGTTCNTANGLCQAPLPADAGEYGLCGTTSSCASGAECLALVGQGADGGFCTTPCVIADGGGCPGVGRCAVTEAIPDGGVEGRCAQECDAGSECAAGLKCLSVPAGTLGDGGARSLGLCAP